MLFVSEECETVHRPSEDDVFDPVHRLLHVPTGSVRRLRPGYWIGIGCLIVVVAVAAFAVPLLLSASPGHRGSAAPAGSPAADPPSGDPTGSATAPPTADPANFTPVAVQAEDPNNTLIGDAAAVACGTCDGGARIRYIGGTSELVVYLDVPVAGTRTVTVECESDGYRRIKMTIDGGAPIVKQVLGTGWEVPRSFSFTATVPAGRVAVRFYNDTEPAPDIDKVTIS